MEYKINNLFPTPVLEFDLKRDFTEYEINYIFNSALERNQNNSITIEKNILDSEELKNIKLFVVNCLQSYIDKILLPKNKIIPFITESWVNVTEQGESHHRHMHVNSFVSGVFYISSDKHKDKIEFYSSIPQYILEVETDNYNLYNSNSWWLPAIPGRLYLFPSTLLHEVKKTTSEVLRISLSFNTFIKGNISTNKTSKLILN